jgi:Putative amidoligase enzyme
MTDLQIGFELEFCSADNHPVILEQLRALGLNITYDDRHRNPARVNTNWYLTHDGSVRWQNGDPRGPTQGHELISPVFPLEPGLKIIQGLFKWIENNGHWTNSSTGFHVGISFVNKPKNSQINRLKLLALLEEDKYLRKFKRTSNRFCRSHKKNLSKQFADTLAYAYRYAGDKAQTAKMLTPEYLQGAIPTNKYFSVNFGKLTQNYLEFRIIGGKNYHKRFDDVKEAILHFCECMQKSTSKRLTTAEKEIIEVLQIKGLKVCQKSIQKDLKAKQAHQKQLQIAAERSQREAEKISQFSAQIEKILATKKIQYA